METIIAIIIIAFVASRMRRNKAASVSGTQIQDVPVQPVRIEEANYKPELAIVSPNHSMPSIAQVARRFIGEKPGSERALENEMSLRRVDLGSLQSELHQQELVCFTMPAYRTDTKAKPCFLVFTDQRIGLAGVNEHRWWPISRIQNAANIAFVSGNPVSDFFNISKDPSFDRIEVKIPGDPFGNRFFSYSAIRVSPIIDFLKARLNGPNSAFQDYLLPEWIDQVPIFYGRATVTYKSGNLPASNTATEISNLKIGQKCSLIVSLDGGISISDLRPVLASSLQKTEVEIRNINGEYFLHYQSGSQYGDFKIETADIALAALAYQTALKNRGSI